MAFSVVKDLVEDTAEQRRTFFKLVYGSAKGYICLSYGTDVERGGRIKKDMRKIFFQWPEQMEDLLENIDAHANKLVHAYFCPNLYGQPGDKHKEYISTCTNIWADLDTCNPRYLLVEPSILIESSPGKYQALWLLEDPVDPQIAQEIALRIAYAHAPQGADKSGWDLSQLLRIPYTPNLKYGDLAKAPIVTIIHSERLLYRPKDFDVYPQVQAFTQYTDPNRSFEIPQGLDPERIIEQYGLMAETSFRHYYEEPAGDWSNALWAMVQTCREYMLTREQAFVVLWSAKCNKYARDGRPPADMYHEIDKAGIKSAEQKMLVPTPTSTIPTLLSEEEVEQVLGRKTFVERYIDWASKLTDAATQYHQSGAFMILSSLMAGNIKLYTNFGSVIPNMWFMLLGNTTLTRKTTAMNIAMNLLYEIDERALLATDGSLEGILVGMRDRPHQPSIFLRDEFSGLLEIIAHKEYMAGFAEQLTKLYDGEPLKRLLRKETIDIRDPIFNMYVGGPKDKTQMLITEDLVIGGFLPRFIIITAEPDFDRVQDIGPPVARDTEQREFLKNELIEMHNHYVQDTNVSKDGQPIGKITKTYPANLTPEAWKRYNEYERLLTRTAYETGLDYLTPVYDRLAKSTLKAAILIAASRQRIDTVTVELIDLLHAIYYARFWREYSSEIVNGIGKTFDERLIDRIYDLIVGTPMGVPRSELMNIFHLDARRANMIFQTMEQRQMVTFVDGRFRKNQYLGESEDV
jgi:hypothetical protein